MGNVVIEHGCKPHDTLYWKVVRVVEGAALEMLCAR